MSYDSDDFLSGGGAPAISWKNAEVGKTITGQVLTYEKAQQRDIDGNLAFWDAKPGEEPQPKWEYIFTLKTDYKNWDHISNDAKESKGSSPDDGERRLFVRGAKKPESLSMRSAIMQAVQKAGCRGKEDILGGIVSVTYTGDGRPSQKGYNAPKQYQAKFEKGVLPQEDFLESDEEPF